MRLNLGLSPSSRTHGVGQLDLFSPSYTGGAMSVLDTDGVLQSVLANHAAYQGATFSSGDFSRPINATAAYPVGLVSKPATTNTFLNPQDISQASWAKFGTATTPNANTLLTPASGDGMSQNGGTYNLNDKVTLSAVLSGSGTCSLLIFGTVLGSMYSPQITLTSTPTMYQWSVTGAATEGLTGYVRRRPSLDSATSITVDHVQFETGTFATPAVIGTSAATVSAYSASLLQAQNTGIDFYCEPMGAGQTEVLWGSYVDADNYTQILLNPTDITLRKRVSATSHDAVLTYSHSTTGFRLQAYWSDAGLGVTVLEDGGSWETWATDADTTAAQLDSTYELGSDGNNLNQAAGFLGGTSGKFKVFTAASGAELIAKMESVR